MGKSYAVLFPNPGIRPNYLRSWLKNWPIFFDRISVDYAARFVDCVKTPGRKMVGYGCDLGSSVIPNVQPDLQQRLFASSDRLPVDLDLGSGLE